MASENRNTQPTALELTLAEQAEALEREIAADTRQKQLDIVKRALAEMEAVRKGEPVRTKLVLSPTPKAQHFRRAGNLPDAAAYALEDEGRPMTPMELLPFIRRYGRLVGGKNPSWNLSNAMSSNRELFIPVEWGGGRKWWLAGKPIPKEED